MERLKMSVRNKNKYRFDLYVQRNNALSLINFSKSNGISVNSMINHLIVSFLLNKSKYAFNFVDTDEVSQQGINNQKIQNDEDTYDDSGDCLPDILKQLLDDNNDNLEYDF